MAPAAAKPITRNGSASVIPEVLAEQTKYKAKKSNTPTAGIAFFLSSKNAKKIL